MNQHCILGIVLVRNEDRFLGQALANVSAFCDRFLLFDNDSRDNSPEILARFAASHPAAVLTTIGNPGDSHTALAPFAGTRTWVFGVDGDELYDPQGLATLKPRLVAGEFDAWWMLSGHCLHVEELDAKQAVGFMAPPSRTITKLYNFAAIDAWPGRSHERLHGGRPAFRPGFDATQKYPLHEKISWDASPLRCLHTCFLRRSSLDPEHPHPRMNIDELAQARPVWKRLLSALVRRGSPSTWKRERYRRGSRVQVNPAPFF